MISIVQSLWLIPALPIAAGGVIALMKQRQRRPAAALAIGAMGVSFLLSVAAFVHVLALGQDEAGKQIVNFRWFQLGSEWVTLGWILDPLTSVMLVMVTLVGLLVFIYSIGYMAEDKNFTRFFCFLSLFAGAMLGVLLANSLLLLFMCWEVVGLTSYLLIGFWYDKPRAAAAAKKAFLVTRIGDIGLFLGMVWLYAQTGTLLFYDGGRGCLEHSATTALLTHTTVFGAAVSTVIALLIFCGAAGKSGQLPLHVWLPDAMEGPTPVSALIHAATMVAAGVFLVARVYPLMSASMLNAAMSVETIAKVGAVATSTPTVPLEVITWVGAITAIFGAMCAVAQFDIKRVLAYSTVSQLGYMMMGLGVGGVAVGMFHLLTHAFFKSLLFLGAGSVIHGCHGEQDIRRMGGLRRILPITFATYAMGMLALCGVPLFSGFWSKDEILHAAFAWSVSRTPFYLGAIGAFLTAFYMARQVSYMFTGQPRWSPAASPSPLSDTDTEEISEHTANHTPHESPAVMTTPLLILAGFAIFLGFVGTTAWPWLQDFLEGGRPALNFAALFNRDVFPLMLASSALVFLGLGVGWGLYHRKIQHAEQPDALENIQPKVFFFLGNAFCVDWLYKVTVVRWNGWLAHVSAWFDRWIWNGAVQVVSYSVAGLAWLENFFDKHVVNSGFDEGCETVSASGKMLSWLQAGRVQGYLGLLGVGFVVAVALLLWRVRS